MKQFPRRFEMILRDKMVAVMALTLAASGLAHAAGLADPDLPQKKAAVDGKLANRIERIKKEVEKRDAFQAGLAKERQDFERHMAEEHRAFMSYLLSVMEPDRAKALGQFEDKQDNERYAFDKRQ